MNIHFITVFVLLSFVLTVMWLCSATSAMLYVCQWPMCTFTIVHVLHLCVSHVCLVHQLSVWRPFSEGDAQTSGGIMGHHHRNEAVRTSRTEKEVINNIHFDMLRYCEIIFSHWTLFLYAQSETSDVLCYGVRPSVCPSVSHIMSAQYLEKFLSDSHGTW